MAKAKKQDTLSFEEKLGCAITDRENQLYDIPINWCWTTIENLVEICLGLTHTPTYVEKGIPFLSVKDITGGCIDFSDTKFITQEEYDSLPYGAKPQKGDILFARVGTIGAPQIVETDKEFGTFVSLGFFRPRSVHINRKYIAYWIDSILFEKQVSENVKGSTLKNLNTGWLKHFQIPLPPANEQQRIVEQIESLFVKLDEAKEKAHEIVEKFETVEHAILYAAFTGELTKKWRIKNDRSIDTWCETTLQDVCCMKITDGTHKTPTYCEKEQGGIPFISAKDVTTKKICWDNIKYIVPELHEELYARLAPQVDDVLLAKNGTTGVAAIVEEDKIFDLYVTLAVLRPDKSIINPRYLLNIVNSPVCKLQFDEHLTGIGVPNLHLRDIKDVKIPLPLLDEQEEIIRIVDSLLRKEKRAFEIAKTTIEKIEIVKKTVLAKAFRGELNTNNPNEESAIELLKRIIAEE